MLFPTAEYAIFFLCVFAAAWSLHRNLLAHKTLLLIASYGFYASWSWRLLPLLVGISLVAAAVGSALQVVQHDRARKALLGGGVALVLGALVLFKYLGFIATGALNLLELLGLRTGWVKLPEILLPVGISFFVFHAISLMVDAFRARIPVRVNTLDALLYVAFFPQLVAGPILRAHSFLPQLAKLRDPAAIDASRALELIVSGLAKKVLIASFIASHLVDPVFDSLGARFGPEVLLACYGYAAVIYCDFSGYSDIAIGSALLLGYRMPENFDAPYLAVSPRDFWRRWHISLSSWLRDYLFIPLGGSRHGQTRTLTNLGITMILGGLWHGAAWNFVAWGAYHGVGLVAHRLWSESRFDSLHRLRATSGWTGFSWLLTFHFVCFGWVLFRAPSLEGSWEFLRALGRWEVGPSVSAAVVLAIGVGLFSQLFPSRQRAALRGRFAQLPLTAQGLVVALAILLIEALGPQGVPPFIYFQF